MRTYKFDIDLPSLSLSVASGVISNFVYDKLKSRRNHLSRSNYREASRAEKRHILSDIAMLHQIPEFDIPNATTDRYLVDIFSAVTIEALIKFKVSKSELEYICGNHSCKVSSKTELIRHIENARRNLYRNDSRYRLGFRTLSYLITYNIDKISVEELKTLMNRLRPFFSVYSRKEYLGHYAIGHNYTA